jgi:hypothetical protein
LDIGIVLLRVQRHNLEVELACALLIPAGQQVIGEIVPDVRRFGGRLRGAPVRLIRILIFILLVERYTQKC